jgi:hypothetical protein
MRYRLEIILLILFRVSGRKKNKNEVIMLAYDL